MKNTKKKGIKAINYPLYMPDDLRIDLQAIADCENRSLHSQLINILKKATEKYNKRRLT